MKPAHLLLLALMNVFWAASYPAFKALSPHLDAGGVTTLRFGLAALIGALLWPWLPGRTPLGRDCLKVALMGVIVFVIGPRLQVAGVQLGQAGDAAVLSGLEPLITSVAAALVLRERIGPRRWAGFALGLSGVLFMARVWRPDFQLPGLVANALFVASFVCEAAYSVMGKPLLARAGLARVLVVALLAGTAVNLALDGPRSFAGARALPTTAWLMLLYLTVVCTLLGYAIWFVVIRETEVNVAALTIFIQPAVGVLLARFGLGETLHWGQFWGCVAILLGVIVGLSRQLRR